MKTKQAVANLGAEELSFLKQVRLTRADTRAAAEALFSSSHQCRARDVKLMEKLFVQAPAAITMAPNLQKEASADQWEQYEKIKIAYNVHHFFESGSDKTAAQRRFPELMKAATPITPALTPKKLGGPTAPTGATKPQAGQAAGTGI